MTSDQSKFDTPSDESVTNRVTIVIPFYNEEAFISETLESLAEQRFQPADFVLVDNGSTDRSLDLCRQFAARHPGITVKLVPESRPGKINALETALPFVQTDIIAFCDADTIYPAHYIELALELIDREDDIVGALALGIHGDADTGANRLRRRKGAIMGAALAKQCHTGGYGQIFRTDVVKKTGGYSIRHWPYVLSDHEIVHRILKHGRCVYHQDLWCAPSARRENRRTVRWNLAERVLYHITPFGRKDWFFYKFLGPRFAKRNLSNLQLRSQPWADAPKSDGQLIQRPSPQEELPSG